MQPLPMLMRKGVRGVFDFVDAFVDAFAFVDA